MLGGHRSWRGCWRSLADRSVATTSWATTKRGQREGGAPSKFEASLIPSTCCPAGCVCDGMVQAADVREPPLIHIARTPARLCDALACADLVFENVDVEVCVACWHVDALSSARSSDQNTPGTQLSNSSHPSVQSVRMLLGARTQLVRLLAHRCLVRGGTGFSGFNLPPDKGPTSHRTCPLCRSQKHACRTSFEGVLAYLCPWTG